MIYLFMVPVAALAAYLLHKNYSQGLAAAVFALTLLSSYIQISLGSGLPNLTVHRILLLLIVIFSITAKRWKKGSLPPYRTAMVVYAAVNLLPLVFAEDFAAGIKSYLSFCIEGLLFFWVVSISLDTREQARSLAKAACLSLALVGLLAIIERYTKFNPLDAWLPGYTRAELYKDDVMVTFPHRILLGTALAMGWPLALAFAQERTKYAWVYGISLVLMLGGCYFSFSRGPWMAAVLGGAVMLLFGGKQTRKISVTVAVLALVLLIVRPGVWDTIHGRIDDTRNVNSFKGQTYAYRWELWGIAWKKISPDPLRTLFGYGPGATEHMSIDAVLSYTGETFKTQSWDNHYAATMVEGGLTGLGLLFFLYGITIRGQVQLWRRAEKRNRTLQAAILSGMLGLAFMMSNVAIFAIQIHYLYWTLTAVGAALGAAQRKPGQPETGVSYA
jgi:hypothetical protein